MHKIAPASRFGGAAAVVEEEGVISPRRRQYAWTGSWLRVVVISGYLDSHIEARLAELPFVHEVMRKPFDLLVFAAVVRRLAAAEGLPHGSSSATEH